MSWPFSRKAPPPSPIDARKWNEDWRVGDTAECIVDGVNVQWHDCVPPWCRPEFGQRLTVSGFSDEVNHDAGIRAYLLHFSDWPLSLATTAFRKVRPVSSEKSEVVERILNAKPDKDRTRKPADEPAR